MAIASRSGLGTDRTHSRMGTSGKTRSTRWAAVCAICRPPQDYWKWTPTVASCPKCRWLPRPTMPTCRREWLARSPTELTSFRIYWRTPSSATPRAVKCCRRFRRTSRRWAGASRRTGPSPRSGCPLVASRSGVPTPTRSWSLTPTASGSQGHRCVRSRATGSTRASRWTTESDTRDAVGVGRIHSGPTPGGRRRSPASCRSPGPRACARRRSLIRSARFAR
ncbi:MAG: hypothetical protein ACI80K_001533 [Paracoccaceae bacterium]|jgi:hypothetical protein